MSLLIKALRQAEKQNEQAARRAAEVSIELPPESASASQRTKSSGNETPLSSALSLAVETQTDKASTGTVEAPTAEGSVSFPKLDQDFSQTTDPHGQNKLGRRGESESLEQVAAKADQVSADQSSPDEPLPLSLESASAAAPQPDDDRPPEAFARHAPQGPAESEVSLEPAPSAEPQVESTLEPKPAQPIAEDVAEAAPYLSVDKALPTKRPTRTPLTVIAGFSVISLLVAGAVAAIMWWGGNQAYESDFNAPTSQPAASFVTNDQPLSPLDLGVAVEGTAGASPATAPDPNISNQADANAVSASDDQPVPATPPAAATQSTPQADTTAAAASSISDAASAPPPGQTNRNGSATSLPAQRPSAVAATPVNIPATTSKPALPAVRFVRSTSSRAQTQQLLNDAYQALQRNELNRAQAAYQQALRIDRNLIDGWVGLASVVARQGNRTLATQHYQRALNIDPNDSVARTGLLALAGANLPDESESALRTLISSSEQNAMAELTLANTLARQGRWAEAQQAYFNANAAQPEQPDTIFNLAISLERIRQPRAALPYYEQALALSNTRPTLFDPAQARQRIEAIKQQLQEQ